MQKNFSSKNKRPSFLEQVIFNRLIGSPLGTPLAEYRFHPTRKWRFDFAFPEVNLAVEAEGGVFVGGRHTRGVTYAKDCEKYNQAALLGWTVLRYTMQNIDEIKKDISDFIVNKKTNRKNLKVFSSR